VVTTLSAASETSLAVELVPDGTLKASATISQLAELMLTLERRAAR